MSIYWASAFILPKAIIKQIEKRFTIFLWKGSSTSGYTKVAWKDVCKPINEGGQGIKDIGILNRSLIAKKLCDVIRCDRTSIWVEWLKQGRLHNTSIWTINEKGGSWGWRKMLRLRSSILPMTEFLIGEGRSFYLWKDPWHHLGPLIARFPRGPSLLGLDESAKLQVVIDEGQWQWPFITDLECLEIIYTLPQIHGGDDRIKWRFSEGRPTTQSLYRLFCPPEPKVGWSSLLSGTLKIPRHNFILWLAIQEKLPTIDKPWMTHLGGCILCDEAEDALQLYDNIFDLLGQIVSGQETWTTTQTAAGDEEGAPAGEGEANSHEGRRETYCFGQFFGDPRAKTGKLRLERKSPVLGSLPATMGDQTIGNKVISEDGNGNLTSSDRFLRAETRGKLQTPLLGFLGDEGSHSENPSETGTIQADEGTPDSVEEVETTINEKGFGEASPFINGGRKFEPFNLDEFLKLANAVIDKGDEQTITALRDLKIRWKERFRSVPSLHSLVERRDAPPRVGGLRPAMRCLMPSGTSSGAPETAGNSTDPDLQSPVPEIPRLSAGNELALLPPSTDMAALVKGGRRLTSPATVGIPKPADVASVGDVEGEVEGTVAVDKDGDVTGDASVTSADIIAGNITAYITADDITAEITPNDITADIMDDVSLHKKTEKQISTFDYRAPTGLFVGNIPLHACSDTINDKIAHAFHNSTRKTLFYVAPTVQKGEVIVRPTLDIIRNGSKRWMATAVGYFLGKRPYFHHLKEFAKSIWPDLKEVTGTNNGFFFFQFKSVVAMEDVIEGGPWLYQGQPIIFQKWKPRMVLRKLQHTELWTEEGLSTVASGVGKPLYPDAITRTCMRLDFARVCVMLDVTSNLPKHIIIMTPDEEGGESPCKVDVEYKWIPPKCKSCMTLGHSTKECVLNKSKPVKPPIAVYIPKVGTPHETAMSERSRNHPREDGGTNYIPSRPPRSPDRKISRPPQAPVVEKKREGRDSPRDATGPSREERGKAVVIYNTFDALHILDDTDEATRAIWNVRGLNKRDHQLAVRDNVAEFRLQFLGLLETRVRFNNAAQIQSFLLPHWKWYMDYGSSGNRVWIAWDDNFIDVNVVECGTQFIHCLVNIRAIHESVAVTVAYGATEVVDRRELWNAMENLAIQCADIPWLIGGDFNAVRDLSEVCGTLEDIRIAIEDFNAAIQNTGLLPLPMQGEWYTWHNHNATPRNLWKRLDRMLINDRWMARFPNTLYSVLTPRTSDHSPMVLNGDQQ
ncbi:UNVERIFIED_CONTAM: hypothetical protein Sindi_3122000 [Sesamum indicum]